MRTRASSIPRHRGWPLVVLIAISLFTACRGDEPVAPPLLPPDLPVPPVPAPPAIMATVRGVIISSATGQPVAGATVYVGSVVTVTGADGRFELANLIAGQSVRLVSIASGFVTSWVDFELYPGINRQDLSLSNVPAPPPPLGVLEVSGSISPASVSIRLRRDGLGPVTDASLSLNGIALAHVAADLYHATIVPALAPGSELRLRVISAGDTAVAVGHMRMANPVITAPTTGSSFSATDSVTVSWTAATDPDRFSVCINCFENSLDGGTWLQPGTARSHVIEGGLLVDYGGGSPIRVTATDELLVFSGEAHRGSVSYRSSSEVRVTIRN
jgi:hypothetical protein